MMLEQKVVKIMDKQTSYWSKTDFASKEIDRNNVQEDMIKFKFMDIFEIM